MGTSFGVSELALGRANSEFLNICRQTFYVWANLGTCGEGVSVFSLVGVKTEFLEFLSYALCAQKKSGIIATKHFVRKMASDFGPD